MTRGAGPQAKGAGRAQIWRDRWRWVQENPPPGPFRQRTFRSPLRGPWLTAVLGSVLLVGVPVLFLTGLASYAAYNPDLPGNDLTPGRGLLGFYLFTWPTSPSWLYRLTQGIHVIFGLVLVPVLLAKLWSVIPTLFAWPPVRSAAHALERLSLLFLVGGGIFEFASGPTASRSTRRRTRCRCAPTPPRPTGGKVSSTSGESRSFSREELRAMPQHTAALPISCVEGWSTAAQQRSGVRLRDLAGAVGVGVDSIRFARVESLQERGAFRSAALAANQLADEDSLLALRVNGADLSVDHGFPARVIVPAAPGVHNTKWVSSLSFEV